MWEWMESLKSALYLVAIPAVVIAWISPTRTSASWRHVALLVLKTVVVVWGLYALGWALFAVYVALTGNAVARGYSMQIAMVPLWNLIPISFLLWVIRRARRREAEAGLAPAPKV